MCAVLCFYSTFVHIPIFFRFFGHCTECFTFDFAFENKPFWMRMLMMYTVFSDNDDREKKMCLIWIYFRCKQRWCLFTRTVCCCTFVFFFALRCNNNNVCVCMCVLKNAANMLFFHSLSLNWICFLISVSISFFSIVPCVHIINSCFFYYAPYLT